MAFSYKDYIESEEVKRKREEADRYKNYVASDSVNLAKDALDKHEANRVADWTGGNYGQAVKDSLSKLENRKPFVYDLNGDALYQQYKDQYMNLGRLAMNDAIGQASAMTGGYGNSYASSVGNQAYQGYLGKLNDLVPELYQMALNQYNQEEQNLKDMYSMYNQQYANEYGEYRDKVSDWNTEDARLADRYYNESNMDYNRFNADREYYINAYNNERTYDYGQYSDAYSRAFSNYQQDVAEKQAAAQLAETIRANKVAESQRAAQIAASTASKTKSYDYDTVKDIEERVANWDGTNAQLNDWLEKQVNNGFISVEEALLYYTRYRNGGEDNQEQRYLDSYNKLSPITRNNITLPF